MNSVYIVNKSVGKQINISKQLNNYNKCNLYKVQNNYLNNGIQKLKNI